VRRQHEERVKGRQKHIATSLMKFVRSSRPTAADLVTHRAGGWLAGWGTTHSKRMTMTTLSLTRELPTTTTRLMTPCLTKRCSVYPCSLPFHDLPCVVATHTLSHSRFHSKPFQIRTTTSHHRVPPPSRESVQEGCDAMQSRTHSHGCAIERCTLPTRALVSRALHSFTV